MNTRTAVHSPSTKAIRREFNEIALDYDIWWILLIPPVVTAALSIPIVSLNDTSHTAWKFWLDVAIIPFVLPTLATIYFLVTTMFTKGGYSRYTVVPRWLGAGTSGIIETLISTQNSYEQNRVNAKALLGADAVKEVSFDPKVFYGHIWRIAQDCMKVNILRSGRYSDYNAVVCPRIDQLRVEAEALERAVSQLMEIPAHRVSMQLDEQWEDDETASILANNARIRRQHYLELNPPPEPL